MRTHISIASIPGHRFWYVLELDIAKSHNQKRVSLDRTIKKPAQNRFHFLEKSATCFWSFFVDIQPTQLATYLTKTAANVSAFSRAHVLVYDYGLRLTVEELECNAA